VTEIMKAKADDPRVILFVRILFGPPASRLRSFLDGRTRPDSIKLILDCAIPDRAARSY
jgi:hypothetical protein